jgi:hypothetical protein
MREGRIRGANAVKLTNELRRVLALPRREPGDYTELAEELTELLKTPNGTMKLRPVQALALHDIGINRGGFLPIGVGEGKTLISLLAPYVLEAKKPMLLLPAGLVENAERARRVDLAPHWLIPTNLRIFSIEMLGRESSKDELEGYGPDAILVDEAHRLKNLGGAACARRVARYMAKHPTTAFVPMSGTIIRDSIHDFAHLLFWALKTGAPCPSSRTSSTTGRARWTSRRRGSRASFRSRSRPARSSTFVLRRRSPENNPSPPRGSGSVADSPRRRASSRRRGTARASGARSRSRRSPTRSSRRPTRSSSSSARSSRPTGTS